jgi:hypothetical protein
VNPTASNPAAMAADPLAQLRGLHLPEAVDVWPPAPGWWVVAVLVVGAAVTAVWLWRRRRASLGARALRELRRIERGRLPDLQSLATSLSELLRRVALERFGTLPVAKLSGESWARFLCETTPAPRRGGARDVTAGRLLSLAPYAPPALWRTDGDGLDRDRLIAAARTWIRGNT